MKRGDDPPFCAFEHIVKKKAGFHAFYCKWHFFLAIFNY